MDDPLPVLTERTRLRRLAVADLADFQRYRNDPDVGRWQGWKGMDDGAATGFLQEMADSDFCPPGRWFQLGIARRDSDQLIGDIGVHMHGGAGLLAELGFTLTPAAQGRGLATEAVGAALQMLLQHTPVQRIVSVADTRNAASLALLQRLGLPADALAAVAVPLLHPAPAWRFQAGRPMQPGSSMKLLTTIVALDHLGPNHRGFTELRSAAALVAGSLEGDLVIKGGADPELGVPQLWALLLDLRQAGVQHIAGDLLVDRSLFRPARIDQGLPPFDESPEFGYNVIPDALMLAGNLLPLEIKATADGVVASTVPPLPHAE